MKYCQRGAWIIEAMIVLFILVSWIIGIYTILGSSQKLSQSTAYRIQAIQIARDWLEAMTNIRDTNWIEFWGDLKNCWNTFNYDDGCLWEDGFDNKIQHEDTEAFIIYRDNSTWKFHLEVKNADNDFSHPQYRDNFRVNYDERWFYTQTGSITLNREYTRKLQVNYIDDNWNSAWSDNPSHSIMEIITTVQWQDPVTSWFRELEMSTRLTNWKDRD